MKDYIVVIPARYESTRLPGKPLVDILGKPMIQRVFEQCLKAVPKNRIYIATDDARIQEVAEAFGANVVMTSEHCMTGTDRVAEVAHLIDAEYYINVQGDEPVFNSEDITTVISSLETYRGEIINGYCPLDSEEDYRSESIPKVVFRPDGRLMYMSRSAIPGNKAKNFVFGYRQVCVYAFPAEALKKFNQATTKTPLENEEDIEILRFVEMGYEVRMLELSQNSIAVDNPEDVDKVVKRLQNGAK